VAICVRRSLEMMVGLLGILNAGGCYVPLDPTDPRERLAFMLEDSQATVLLIQESLMAELQLESPNLTTLDITEHSVLAPNSDEGGTRNTPYVSSPPRENSLLSSKGGEGEDTGAAANLAYIIYTSGSTGRPKGVMLTHRNVVNFFAGMDRLLGTEPGVWLAVTSISFDISVLELFWTLARGFKVVIHAEEDQSSLKRARALEEANGHRFSVPEQIIRHKVTHVQCTPSLAGTLVLAPESVQAMRSLSKLLLGGEALPSSLLQKLRPVILGEIFNMYGPTETTVWSSAYRVDQVGEPVPIGKPIANTQIYILDQQLQPLPMGVPGEVFIGGEGVARGYLKRPELTAEKFIRNPFSADPDARLYRTGDLARYRPDGNLEFLGRVDQQIKLRGHRIELGEIEAVLRQHPAISECAVRLWEHGPEDQRLAAYVTCNGARPPSGEEFRRFLQEKLPASMVPSIFMPLEKLPLTPNGKIDRTALPKPAADRASVATAYIAPRTALERTIAGIWRELLHIEQAGLQDNFFDLGGHSLLVVKAQSKLRDALGIDLPVVKLFQYPTVSALAGFLSQREQTPDKGRDRGRRKQAAYANRAKQEHEVIA